MLFLSKKRFSVRLSRNPKHNEKIDSYTPKRHLHHLFATRLGRQTVGLHFASSGRKRRLSGRFGVCIRSPGGEDRVQCVTLPGLQETAPQKTAPQARREEQVSLTAPSMQVGTYEMHELLACVFIFEESTSELRGSSDGVLLLYTTH